MNSPIFLIAAILLGACVGSFLNVVIYRLPEGSFFSKGKRSKCRSCGAPIAWYLNLPVISWLLIRGRARCCGTWIGARYFVVEVMTSALFGYLWYRLTHDVELFSATDGTTFLFQAWLLAMLVACTFIDVDHRILPDVLTKPTMVIGCIGALVVPGLADPEMFGFADLDPRMESLIYSIAGMAAGILLTWGVRILAGKVFGQEALGFGDVKFMGAIGAFVGWDGALIVFFLGCLFGAVYGSLHAWITGEGQVFFGPFLALGAVITLFFKGDIQVFLTKTWPEWQSEVDMPPWVLAVTSVVCVFLLIVIIKRGRSRA